MNKKSTLTAFIVSLVGIFSLFGFTRPGLGSSWLIVLFFCLYYVLVYSSVRLVGTFLKLKTGLINRVSLITASVMLSLQVLITFQALRPLELMLLVAVFSITSWYVAKAKS